MIARGTVTSRTAVWNVATLSWIAWDGSVTGAAGGGGDASAANQITGNASLASIDSKLTNPLPVSGPLTDTQARATPIPVSGTVAVTNGALANLDVALSTRTKPADQQHTIIDSGANIHVVVDTAPSTPVTGAFFQATQPVSIAAVVPISGTVTVSPVDASGQSTTDAYNQYRLQEKQYLLEVSMQMQLLLEQESHSSHAIGFELR